MGFGTSEERELTAARERLMALSRDADRWLSDNVPALTAGAFGAGFVVGLAGGSKRALMKALLRVIPLAGALLLEQGGGADEGL
ncbi:hypothetical protein [Thermanaerovibrio velox]|uniref:hypothetical protein n=1 Tax=Thermanaerovibrio velox TaxID=108007 RepID=UPI0002D705AD|nr:hypothetical protein [Thermanaerovibrio velox]